MTVIPEKAFTQHTAILGKTGSGKTYTAKGIVEGLLSEKKRVCIIDPTGVWWGLKSTASGKRGAFHVVVFGGSHADVPLSQTHGSTIAEIIGTTDISAIIDTEQMTVGERTRFFTDFAETLLRKNKGPLNLILDEAHVFAPQGKIPDPQAGRMLHAANNLVSLGRSKGLRITMISQRPAKLHKDSLTQAGTLIAMRLMAPQDREAVKAWISEWADQAKGQEIMQSLPGLPIGTGWVWSPEADFLKRVEFPKITTYDSSAAPDGERENVVLASIDLPSIEERLHAVSKDALDNDPKRLRAKIAELEKAAKNVAPAAPSILALEQANEEGYDQGFSDGHQAGYDLAIQRLQEQRNTYNAQTRLKVAALPPKYAQKPENVVQKRIVHAASGPGESMAAAERKFLTVLAQRGQPLTRNKIAIFAGYSVKSGHIDNTLGALRSKGWATGGNSGVKITESGLQALGEFEPLPTGEQLRAYWLGEVDKAGSTFLKILFDVYPDTISRNDLAEKAGYSPSSGHVDNTLGRLRSLDLAEGRNDGIKASDDLFQEAA